MEATCHMYCYIPFICPVCDFHFFQTLHDKIYSVVRPLRLGLHAVLPYLEYVSLDIFTADCLIENPLLSDEDTCHCFRVKEVTEIELNETHTKIPPSILDLPTYDVYVVRNATKIGPDLTPNSFGDFLLTRGIPNVCMEMSSDSHEGLKLFTDFSNKEKIRQYLDTDEPWAYTWWVQVSMKV